MASPSIKMYMGSFTGVAADVTVGVVPFRPRKIEFYAPGGVWGYKSDEMAGNAYLSSVGADAGVTISDSGFVVANGADVNVAAAVVHYVATSW